MPTQEKTHPDQDPDDQPPSKSSSKYIPQNPLTTPNVLCSVSLWNRQMNDIPGCEAMASFLPRAFPTLFLSESA